MNLSSAILGLKIARHALDLAQPESVLLFPPRLPVCPVAADEIPLDKYELCYFDKAPSTFVQLQPSADGELRVDTVDIPSPLELFAKVFASSKKI